MTWHGRWLLARALPLAILVTGCAPSLPYQAGRGFYSDDFSKAQLDAAASAGKVRNLGRFSMEAGGCFNYSEEKTEQKVVVPALKQKLKEMGANAAANVLTHEKWSDFFLGLLIVPGFMACNNWEISGEALRIEKDAV